MVSIILHPNLSLAVYPFRGYEGSLRNYIHTTRDFEDGTGLIKFESWGLVILLPTELRKEYMIFCHHRRIWRGKYEDEKFVFLQSSI